MARMQNAVLACVFVFSGWPLARWGVQVRTETETGQISVIHWPNIESEAEKLKQKPKLKGWGKVAVRWQ